MQAFIPALSRMAAGRKGDRAGGSGSMLKSVRPIGEEPVGGGPVGEALIGEEPIGEEPIDEEPIDEDLIGEDIFEAWQELRVKKVLYQKQEL